MQVEQDEDVRFSAGEVRLPQLQTLKPSTRLLHSNVSMLKTEVLREDQMANMYSPREGLVRLGPQRQATGDECVLRERGSPCGWVEPEIAQYPKST